MKKSTSILRGMNGIRANYILESELTAEELAAAYRPTAKEKWQQITSGGWFTAAACAVVSLGVLTGIILAGQKGPGTITPAGTLPESTPGATESVEKVTPEPSIIDLRVLKAATYYDAEGNETSRTKYTYDGNGWLLEERYYTDGRGFARKVYTYNADGFVIQEKYIFDEADYAGWTTTYAYDGQGHVVLKRTIYNEGRAPDEERTEYDELGRISRKESAEWVTTYTYGENDSFVSLQVYKNEDTVIKQEETLDVHGNVTRMRRYRNDSITGDLAYEYDSDGRCIQCIEYGEDGSVNSTDTYEYEDGNLVRHASFSDGNLRSTYTYFYNEYGERVREEFCYMDAENPELVAYSNVVYEYGGIH